MNKTLTGFSATLNGSACIFDYFQLTGTSNPLVQFISAYVMQVKHWRFTEMEKVEFKTSELDANQVLCTFTFNDSSVRAFTVMQDEQSRYFVKE
jgi:hypothetical protein